MASEITSIRGMLLEERQLCLDESPFTHYEIGRFGDRTLDTQFVNTWGGTSEDNWFTAWPESRVYHSEIHDGLVSVSSIMRNPEPACKLWG